MRNERGVFLGTCRKILSQCPLLTFLPSSGRSRERLKIKSLEKIFIPSLGRQREGQKINPLEKFFCFGSKSEPFSYAGLFVAPKWSHFSSMASKLMPFPFRFHRCGSKIDAIKISACLFSEADAHFSYSVFTAAAGSAAH